MPPQHASTTWTTAARALFGIVVAAGLLASAPAAGVPATATAQDNSAAQAPPDAAISPLPVADPTQYPPVDPSVLAAQLDRPAR